jgi:hypothetical protein
MSGAAPSDAVPDWLVGLWRRESLTLSTGAEDVTTHVFWGQTRSIYVDIRIPADRPSFAGRRSAGDCTPEELRALARQMGFAGRLALHGPKCTWLRDIDFQPDTGRPDTGLLRCEGDVLYETGEASSVIGHAYQEVYAREASGSQRLAALKLKAATGGLAGAAGAILLVIDDRFLFARPRPSPLPAGRTLEQLVEARIDDRDFVRACLDCEVSIGWIGPGQPSWTIALSTLPFREGRRVFPQARAGIVAGELRLNGGSGTSRWQIVECSGPPEALVDLLGS